MKQMNKIYTGLGLSASLLCSTLIPQTFPIAYAANGNEAAVVLSANENSTENTGGTTDPDTGGNTDGTTDPGTGGNTTTPNIGDPNTQKPINSNVSEQAGIPTSNNEQQNLSTSEGSAPVDQTSLLPKTGGEKTNAFELSLLTSVTSVIFTIMVRLKMKKGGDVQ